MYLEFGTVVNSWSEFEKMKAEDPKERPSAAEAPKTEEVRTDRGGCVYFEVILKSFHLRFRLEKTASLTAAEKTRKVSAPYRYIDLNQMSCANHVPHLDHVSYEIVQKEQI